MLETDLYGLLGSCNESSSIVRPSDIYTRLTRLRTFELRYLTCPGPWLVLISKQKPVIAIPLEISSCNYLALMTGSTRFGL